MSIFGLASCGLPSIQAKDATSVGGIYLGKAEGLAASWK